MSSAGKIFYVRPGMDMSWYEPEGCQNETLRKTKPVKASRGEYEIPILILITLVFFYLKVNWHTNLMLIFQESLACK